MLNARKLKFYPSLYMEVKVDRIFVHRIFYIYTEFGVNNRIQTYETVVDG